MSHEQLDKALKVLDGNASFVEKHLDAGVAPGHVVHALGHEVNHVVVESLKSKLGEVGGEGDAGDASSGS